MSCSHLRSSCNTSEWPPNTPLRSSDCYCSCCNCNCPDTTARKQPPLDRGKTGLYLVEGKVSKFCCKSVRLQKLGEISVHVGTFQSGGQVV